MLEKLILGAAIFLILFAAIGFLAVPPIAQHYLVKGLSEALDREVSIEDIDLNPFSMVVVVKGFAVKEPNSSEVFVGFSELRLNLQAESLFRLAPILRQLRLINPYVHVVRNADGRTYNFSDLIEKFSKPAPSADNAREEEPRFSLNNIELVNGRIEIDDRPKNARHTVKEISLAIPFLSNLPYRVEDYVRPAFSARVNETPFSLHGRTKPFKDTLETSVDLDIDRLNVPRYMEYVPVDLGFRVSSGYLDTRLTASFVRAEGKAPSLVIKGYVGLDQFRLTERNGQPLFNLASLKVPVSAIHVFGRKVELGTVDLQAPEAFVRREPDGGLNWLAALPATEAGPAPATDKPAEPIAVSVAEVRVINGQVHVRDMVPEKEFRTDLTGIQARLTSLALPQSQPAQVELVFGTDRGVTVKHAGSLSLSPVASEGVVEAKALRLVDYAPYYERFILYRMEDGVADVSTRYSFVQTDSGPDVKLSALNLDLSAARMRKPGEKEDFLRVRQAQLRDATVDLQRLSLTVGQLSTRDGFLNIIRERDGAINVTRILPAPQEASTEGRQGTPWLVTLNRADVQKWKIAYTDLMTSEPVKLIADAIALRATGISNQQGRKGTIDLKARLNETGTLVARGPLGINPVSAALKVELQRLPLVPLQPYFADKLNILLTSAEVSAGGDVKLEIPSRSAVRAGFNGDVLVGNFASVDKPKSEDFLKWNALQVGGIAYAHNPMTLAIDAVALSDFYSRIIISPEGRLNLQDIVVKPEDKAGEAGAKPPAEPASSPRTARSGRGTPAAAPAASARPLSERGAATQASQPAETMPPIRIAKVTLQGGNVNFTDLFIRPNYSANLTEIGGAVTGLSSQLDTAADVDLRGRFAKTAPVEIKGKINPLVNNLFLDLKANVRDIELGPFTPYSGKYVGYGIEKGKMTFDVEYKIDNRKLSATNRLVLDQLTFGEKIESPQATKLPVLLAVSLLKDRNGVIDISLPVSGSLDDPEFSIGGLIIRVIVNLITKAVTAPFALIGSLAGGGGEELSYVEFEPGRAVLSPAAEEKLRALQKGLVERPQLKLDITPRADPASDREGLRRYEFEQQVKAQKLKDLVKQGQGVQSVDEVVVAPEEYEKYLTRAYKAADFPRPRNFIGLLKALPVEEMEKLMLTNTPVTDDDLLQLANERAQLTKDFLTNSGEVPLERVFLIAPKLEAPKPDEARKASRVDFSLK